MPEGLGKLLSDPELLSIMLGTMGTALSEPGSWEERLGTAATGLARGKKRAAAAEKAQQQQKEFMDAVLRMLGGGITPAGEEGLEGVSFGPKGAATLKMTLPTKLGGGTTSPVERFGARGKLSGIPDVEDLMGSLLGPY